MKARTGRHTKDKALLISMAESIGSTLGSIAAKADATQKALSPSHIAETIQREGKNLVRKSKSVARRTSNKDTQSGEGCAARRDAKSGGGTTCKGQAIGR